MGIRNETSYQINLFLDENGKYTIQQIVRDCSNHESTSTNYHTNYDIHESIKNEFELDFNSTIWNLYLILDNPQKQRELNVLEIIFPLPILESSVKINDDTPLEYPYEDTTINRIYRIRDKLNVGENIVYFSLEIPKAINNTNRNSLKIFGLKFHSFPLDEYTFEKSVPLVKFNNILLDDISVKILKIPTPYRLDIEYSGLVNRVPSVKISTNISPNNVKYGDVLDVIGEAYFQEEYIQKFNFAKGTYNLYNKASDLVNPKIKIKIKTPKEYTNVVYTQILISIFFILIGLTYFLNKRKNLLKDKIDVVLNAIYLDKINIFGEKILNYWTLSGIFILSTFYFIKESFIDNITIPYLELNADYTLLNLMTWLFIVIIYISFFWGLDILIKKQQMKNNF